MNASVIRLGFALFVAAPLCACVVADGGGRKNRDRDVYVYDNGGPPPWAPAHGYRRKTAYRYYPDQETYYNIEKNEYVWLDHGKWKRGAHCDHVHNHDHYVTLDIDGDHPEHVHHHVTKVHKGHGKVHHNTSDTDHGHDKHVDTSHGTEKQKGKKPGKSDDKAQKSKKDKKNK